MKSAALDLDYDLDPFDWSMVKPASTSAGSMRLFAPEPLAALQHWYDLGFVGVVQQGKPYPDGYDSATSGELMAFWMGERDAATDAPRQNLLHEFAQYANRRNVGSLSPSHSVSN